MKSKDLANFHNVHERTTRKWSQEQRHRKTIQAEADVTPIEWQLVGEISQLCYLYNAMNWQGAMTTQSVVFCVAAKRMTVSFYYSTGFGPERELTAETSNTAEMQLIKMQLEKLVYGEEK